MASAIPCSLCPGCNNVEVIILHTVVIQLCAELSALNRNGLHGSLPCPHLAKGSSCFPADPAGAAGNEKIKLFPAWVTVHRFMKRIRIYNAHKALSGVVFFTDILFKNPDYFSVARQATHPVRCSGPLSSSGHVATPDILQNLL